jgi:hypothetical protein
MGLFRRRNRHEADQPAEEAAEMRETSGSSLFGPGARSSVRPAGSGWFGFVRPIDDTIATDEPRISANHEDDGAQSQMIDSERRREEYDA